ncbi:FAD-binding domain-containing protein [Obba rivulosa]|uniref:FAD-binding domain-containing protein n=1 Tax=Obba rivulosa TaxID=1052685 RepID=A0A8E2DU34_9APHY|nr:FAD-binding domain-containing protein [Obba rivulosa]
MADFNSFKSKIKGDIVTPLDPGYEEAIARWSRLATRRAQLVVYPKEAQDVAAAIGYSKQASLPLAIRGGGHNPSAASSTGGLVIDLSRYFSGVRVDPVKKVAFVGGGALWAAVDKATIKHGLATVGGTVNHVCHDHLLLGGGYGWLSAKHGLAIDNLIQATVVTADGSILTANASENSDLFWGIRGGGCNFGVCTEFVLQLHPQQSHVYGGLVIFTADKLQSLATAVQSWWLNGPSENEGMMFMMTRGPDGNPCVILNLVYNGSEVEGRQKYKSFFDIGPIIDLSKEIPFEELNASLNDKAAHGRNYYMKGAYHAPDFNLPERAAKAFDLITRLTEGGGYDAFIACELVPTYAVNRVADDATAFRRGRRSNVVCNFTWDDDSPEKHAFARAAAAQLVSILADSKPSENVGYGNYSDVTAQDRAKLLFDTNYPRLQELKRKYDPDMVFNKWFAITPAVSA